MEREGQKHVFTIAVAAVILAVLLVYSLFFQVRESEVAVVSTFGEPHDSIDSPGLYFKWPRPIQEVHIFDGRLQIFEGVGHQTLTYDDRPLVISEGVGWRITDAKQFVQANGSIDRMTDLLGPLVADAKTKVVGEYRFRNFVSTEEGDLQHAEMERKIQEMVNKALEAHEQPWGVRVELVKLKRIELPQSVTDRVFERMKAERDREVSRIRSEGQARANAIRAEADATRDAILAMADSDAEAIRGQGEVEAAQFYEALDERPELAIFLRKIRALANPNVSDKLTLIIDPSVPPFDVLMGDPDVKVPSGEALRTAEGRD